MSSALEGILDRLRSAGRLDSSGAFTLDVVKARGKLRFQLADGFYVAKLIQAGVLMGCHRIDVWLERDLKVRYWGPELDRLEVGDLLHGLAEPLSVRDQSAAAHLTSGILMAGGRSVGWSDCRMQFQLDSGHVNVEAESTDARFSRMAELTISDIGNGSSEWQVLKTRCGYCPVELWLNDTRIPSWDWGSPRPRLAEMFWGGATEGLPGPAVAAHASVSTLFAAKDRSGQGCWMRLFEGSAPWDCAMALPVGLTGRSALHWVRHGVVVKTHFFTGSAAKALCPVSPKCGAVIVASAEGLTSDFSQFELVEDAAYQARLEQIATRLTGFLERVQKQSQALPLPSDGAGLIFLVGAAVLGAAVTSFSFLSVGMFGLTVPVYCLLADEKGEDGVANQAIRDRLDGLRTGRS